MVLTRNGHNCTSRFLARKFKYLYFDLNFGSNLWKVRFVSNAFPFLDMFWYFINILRVAIILLRKKTIMNQMRELRMNTSKNWMCHQNTNFSAVSVLMLIPWNQNWFQTWFQLWKLPKHWIFGTICLVTKDFNHGFFQKSNMYRIFWYYF